jgi:hypothetical protein
MDDTEDNRSQLKQFYVERLGVNLEDLKLALNAIEDKDTSLPLKFDDYAFFPNKNDPWCYFEKEKADQYMKNSIPYWSRCLSAARRYLKFLPKKIKNVTF